jgi:1-acyl-sn-glycerol-3-phosphate acyltransferase
MIKRRHYVVFTVLRPFFRLFARIAYEYRAIPGPKLRKNEAALILSNHNGPLDPFFLALSFKRPIAFVASDHIFRLGWISSLIRFLVAPIPIVKSQLDLRSLRQIRSVIEDGGLVGLFPEGNRSFNGRTSFIPPSTGKLAKQLNCTLLLYRFDGGYLTTPRWSRYRRKGTYRGQVVQKIEADNLKARSPESIYRDIQEALTVDAFEAQRDQPVAFHGRRLAETLELVLFICPKCCKLATLYSQDDRFRCTCGLHVRYLETGFFEPVDDWSKQQQASGSFLESVAAWDQWQKHVLPTILFENGTLDIKGEQPLFTDKCQRLVLTERAHRSHKINQGQLRLYSDRLVFEGKQLNKHVKQQSIRPMKNNRPLIDRFQKANQKSGPSNHITGDSTETPRKTNDLQNPSSYRITCDSNGTYYLFPITSIGRMIIHGPQTLQFMLEDGSVWEVRSKIRRSAYKYLLVFQLLRQHMKGTSYGFLGI